MEAPFDLSFRIDDRLREVPNAPEEMAKGVAWLRKELLNLPKESREFGQALSQIGVYCRILGRLVDSEEAHKTAQRILTHAKEPRLVLINRIRLAHVIQWQKRFDDADALYEMVITEAQKSFPEELDYAYQHAAKSKFDQGQWDLAIGLFERALTLRRQKGDVGLIESSEAGLEQARRRRGA